MMMIMMMVVLHTASVLMSLVVDRWKVKLVPTHPTSHRL